MKIRVFCCMTQCRLVNGYVSEGLVASVFMVVREGFLGTEDSNRKLPPNTCKYINIILLLSD